MWIISCAAVRYHVSYHRIEPSISYLGLSPLPVTVTTKIITFLVGDPYKPSFATVPGRGDNPNHIALYHPNSCFWLIRFFSVLDNSVPGGLHSRLVLQVQGFHICCKQLEESILNDPCYILPVTPCLRSIVWTDHTLRPCARPSRPFRNST